jgi:ABC-type multidrug transport system fused ATPase/permease subunit
MSGYVQIPDVEAGYDGTERALQGLTSVVKAGEKIVICGRTGRFATPFH